MSEIHSPNSQPEAPTRAQKWRTTIILIEIVVLLAAVLLSTLQATNTATEVGDVAVDQETIIVDHPAMLDSIDAAPAAEQVEIEDEEDDLDVLLQGIERDYGYGCQNGHR